MTALRHRPFRRLVIGLAASQLGDWAYNVALLAYVFERTHSVAWLGATTAARVLPVVVLGPLGGVLTDRFDRRRLMIAADLARAALMGALVMAAWASLPVVVIPAISALTTAAGAAYPACATACVARLVPPAELASANAVRAAVGPICIVTGPALGALALGLGHASAAFALNAITFGVSALAVASIPAGAAFRPAARGGASRLTTELADGARALAGHRLALRLVGADVMASFVYGVLTVALLLVARQVGLASTGYGLLMAAAGLGGVLGSAVAARLAGRGSSLRPVAAALVFVAAPLPVLALTGWLPAVLALAALCGAGSSVVEVMTETTLQRELDDAVLARAYGFAFPAAIAGICVGSAVAAPLIAFAGLVPALSMVTVTVAGYALWISRDASAESRAVDKRLRRNGTVDLERAA